MPQERRFASWFEEKWSGRKDLNLRPPGPEPGALARLRYAPTATLMLQTKRELQLNTGDCRRGTLIRREEAFAKEIGGGSHSRDGNAGRAETPRESWNETALEAIPQRKLDHARAG
jgi:hypothetical protein